MFLFGIIGVFLQLLPDGRLVSRRWRSALWATAAATFLAALVFLVQADDFLDGSGLVFPIDLASVSHLARPHSRPSSRRCCSASWPD